MWSRYPLDSEGHDDGFTLGLLYARVHIPRSAAVELYAVHLLPPWPYASRTSDRVVGPLLTLDHVLLRHAYASSVSTIGVPGSDHRALLTRLCLPFGG